MKTLSARSLARPFGARSAQLVVAALAAASLAGCGEQPTTPPLAAAGDKNSIIICGDDCGGGGPVGTPPIAVSNVTVTTPTLSINGINQGQFHATFSNTGSALHGASYQMSLVQGITKHAQVGGTLNCGAGAGTLPTGSCQMVGGLVAQTSATENPQLVPGAATLEVDLTVGGKTYVGSMSVVLQPGFVGNIPPALSVHGNPYVSQVTITNTGASAMFDVHVAVQAVQASNFHFIANALVNCGNGAPVGTLPARSTCVTTVPISVSNSNPGSGTLGAGPVTVVEQLWQGSTVIGSNSSARTLMDARFSSAPAITSPLVIDGPAQTYSMVMVDNGPNLGAGDFDGYVQQGSTQRALPQFEIECPGVGPSFPSGTCPTTGTISALNSAAGTGTLVPGPATAVIRYKAYFGSLADTVIVPVTLVSNAPPTNPPPTNPAPSIGTVSVTGAATIGAPGPNTPVAIAIGNTGGALSNASLRMMILQGSSERYATNGSQAFDCGAGAGVVPANGCTVNATFFASNTSPGTGAFVAGAAKLIVYLVDPKNAILATKTVAVTLAGQ